MRIYSMKRIEENEKNKNSKKRKKGEKKGEKELKKLNLPWMKLEGRCFDLLLPSVYLIPVIQQNLLT